MSNIVVAAIDKAKMEAEIVENRVRWKYEEGQGTRQTGEDDRG